VILAWLIALLSGMAIQNPPGLLEIAAGNGIKQHGSGPDQIFLYAFTRDGYRREALVLTPGAVFQTEFPESGSPRCVSLLVAMPFNLGDGAVLKISAGNHAIQLALDPAHVRAHRAWLPVRLDLPPGEGRFTLRFEVDAGVRGDFTADWVGLAPGSEPGCLLAAPGRTK
jgi:hypothetical protein